MASPSPEIGLRERKKAQTRDAIADAAIELFERKGYEAATVEEIAAAANVSPRTFFRYFDTKLDVIMQRSDEGADALGALLAARPSQETPLEAVRAVLRSHLADQLRSPGSRLAREMRVVLSTPTLRDQAQEHVAEHRRALVPALAHRMGLPPDSVAARVAAAAVTEAVWASLESWACEAAELEDTFEQAFGALDQLS